MATRTTIAAVSPGRLTLVFETRRPQRRRRLCFDVMAGDTLVAHVRAVVTPGAETARFSAVIDVPPAVAGPLTIAAWPLRRGEDGEAADEAALPFRVMARPAAGVRGAPGRSAPGRASDQTGGTAR
jgi:hypothetical protein